jgi:hypothetical protein
MVRSRRDTGRKNDRIAASLLLRERTVTPATFDIVKKCQDGISVERPPTGNSGGFDTGLISHELQEEAKCTEVGCDGLEAGTPAHHERLRH